MLLFKKLLAKINKKECQADNTPNSMCPILKQRTWDELKTKLREKYPQLTEEDLKYKDGMEKSMLRMVEYKLRKTKQEMRDIIAGL